MIIRICCICKCVLGRQVETERPERIYSHGLCAACYTTYLDQLGLEPDPAPTNYAAGAPCCVE